MRRSQADGGWDARARQEIGRGERERPGRCGGNGPKPPPPTRDRGDSCRRIARERRRRTPASSGGRHGGRRHTARAVERHSTNLYAKIGAWQGRRHRLRLPPQLALSVRLVVPAIGCLASPFLPWRSWPWAHHRWALGAFPMQRQPGQRDCHLGASRANSRPRDPGGAHAPWAPEPSHCLTAAPAAAGAEGVMTTTGALDQRAVIGRPAHGQSRTYRLARPAAREAAYRRLAAAIVGLDVAALAVQLRTARLSGHSNTYSLVHFHAASWARDRSH